MARHNQDNIDRLKRSIEVQRRAIGDLVDDFKTKSATALEQQRLQLQFVHQEVQNDREYLQTRLMHMDDTSVIKKWVSAELVKLEESLRNEYRSELRMLNHKMDKVWDENLLVPGLVGENEMCLYQNLKEYCLAQKTEFSAFRDDFEPTTQKMISEKVISVKNPLSLKINEQKKELYDLKKEIARNKAEAKAALEKERTYIQTSLGELIPHLEA